jgi:exopolyphosphatase/guanosine-5'-triphosphate,3'-diphosphate pyrophosphatase
VPGGKKGLREEIARHCEELADRFGTGQERLFLVGGSWRAIGRLDMERRGYPLHVLHEYRLTPEDVAATIAWIGEHDIATLRSMTGIGEARMSLVPLASQVLGELVRQLEPKEIAISSYGIREGLLYDRMPAPLRDRDPLIEACRFAEKKDSRFPGFGKALFNFVLPLFAREPEHVLRMVKAACLLHDVTWRAHPDYRHEACFDNATRANLSGLNHRERVFLGLSLLHRYKNSRAGTKFEPLLELLTEDEIRRAEVLGRAMRFGAMFAADSSQMLGQIHWMPRKNLLELSLSEDAECLFGEVAQARFKSLASALGAETKVIRGE